MITIQVLKIGNNFICEMEERVIRSIHLDLWYHGEARKIKKKNFLIVRQEVILGNRRINQQARH